MRKAGKNFRIVRDTIYCLCGIWAAMLGVRLLYEISVSPNGIYWSNHPVNIWFDLFPLTLFGFLTIAFVVFEVIVKRRRAP